MNNGRTKILLTNDDGPFSPGLWILYEAIKDLGDVYVVVPETPKSATGLGLTLHKPLRMNKLRLSGRTAYVVSGTPSDVIYVAMNTVVGKPDLVVSGINVGDNLSIQVILSSGTVGAVLQAAIEGIPGIAFSAAVAGPEEMEEESYREHLLNLTREIVKAVLERGMPSGVDVLNVNFPGVLARDIVVVRAARKRFSTSIVKRRDPRGVPYYWLYGQPVEAEPGTDVHTVLEEGKAAVTPLSLPVSYVDSPEVKSMVDEIRRKISW